MNCPRRPGCRIEWSTGIATSSFTMRYTRITLALVLLSAIVIDAPILDRVTLDRSTRGARGSAKSILESNVVEHCTFEYRLCNIREVFNYPRESSVLGSYCINNLLMYQSVSSSIDHHLFIMSVLPTWKRMLLFATVKFSIAIWEVNKEVVDIR